MTTSFKDHFSSVASNYALYRPRYPAELFAYLATLAPTRELAWDCATGSGQAAVALAAHFKRVIATDASATQIANGEAHLRVEYRVAPAEQSGLAAASVDLLTVAQALHWFDLPRFFAEANRVLRPQAVLAVWCYQRLHVPTPAAQEVLDHYYGTTVGPHWPPERDLVEAGYLSIAFPFAELTNPTHPGFVITARLTLDELMGYLGTWSATRRYIQAIGTNPLLALASELQEAWGEAQSVTWPLALRVARKAS